MQTDNCILVFHSSAPVRPIALMHRLCICRWEVLSHRLLLSANDFAVVASEIKSDGIDAQNALSIETATTFPARAIVLQTYHIAVFCVGMSFRMASVLYLAAGFTAHCDYGLNMTRSQGAECQKSSCLFFPGPKVL